MKTLLRHTRTGLYYQGRDKWTNDPDQALDFRFIDRALTYIRTWQLKEVELAFAFEGETLTITSGSAATVGYAASGTSHSTARHRTAHDSQDKRQVSFCPASNRL